jgi:UDP-N-acetylmuramate: L-alanyl-gamma-D-glutamyl-meso-diaminopimelate ligase
MKMGSIKDALPTSLAGADLVFCYTGGLEWDANKALKPLGAKLQCFDDIGRLTDAITRTSRSGDHVLVMSNGGFGNIHEKLLTSLGAP